MPEAYEVGGIFHNEISRSTRATSQGNAVILRSMETWLYARAIFSMILVIA